MLVNFMEKREPVIFYRNEYSDILPILSMVQERVNVSIFLDPNGVERVIGRFHDCEYTIEINNNAVRERLQVSIVSDENTVKYF